MTEQTEIVNKCIATDLVTADFYYDLPSELIAQTPTEQRDASRLLVLNKESGALSHHRFYEVIDYLRPEDMLVVNSSKVIPARLLGTADKNGGPIELLLLKQHADGTWETLVRPGKRARPGATLSFGGILKAEVTAIVEEGNRRVRFTYPDNMPLPPYITEHLSDKDRYQTVYAKEIGSAAAPTAGLHFTPELIEKIKEKGVGFGEVTLHVGLGTFRPVKVERIEEHVMHAEHFSIGENTAAEINRRKRAGGRIIAVGTTSCRVLESVTDENGEVKAMSGNTKIFIYPGYKFKAIDALITNFHLPESTLLMLVSALAGRDHIMNAYQTAVRERYRFFSFGDAMLIV